MAQSGGAPRLVELLGRWKSLRAGGTLGPVAPQSNDTFDPIRWTHSLVDPPSQWQPNLVEPFSTAWDIKTAEPSAVSPNHGGREPLDLKPFTVGPHFYQTYNHISKS